MSDTDETVAEDEATSRFIVTVDGTEAELVYRRRAGRLILVHTGVPDAIGGRGVGGRLVRAALARARAGNLTIVPWCPYARRWLAGHPDETAG
ncbi:MAG TPA: N-acetyltransferase, partial [Acidimicrobiia bacterium]|nr:N-acetyltransferase [Acidimicrobiia bacterium]